MKKKIDFDISSIKNPPWLDESLPKRERALKTKELFPDLSVRKIVEVTGWKGFTHWIVSDEVRAGTAKLVKQHADERRKKINLIKAEIGGCQICGYFKCFSALEFHHTDPKIKEGQIGKVKLKDMEAEIKKCILLCSNCHREVHEGVTAISN